MSTYMSANKSGAAEKGSESAETPILCETCLGPNPFINMSKQPHGKECKICSRPFTVFRWKPGQGMRFKATQICTTCATIKNVCQTCVLDLQYGLPVQVRDTALGLKSQVPKGDINKQYFMNNQESQLDGGSSSALGAIGPATSAGHDMLKQLAKQRSDPTARPPNYNRNKPHLCSFFAKGECTRGDLCPFRHELPINNELSKQNIQDRFHGRNDPVAKKMLGTAASDAGLAPPEDKEVTSLFLSALPPTITDAEIRTWFVTNVPSLQPHQIKSITLVQTSKCAFVNFRTRAAAEEAAMRCAAKVEMGGKEVRIAWGRSRPAKKAGGSAAAGEARAEKTG
ncbi:pre-mRNA-splicing factor SLT11 [Microstroma glucosiphilum]|uniref:Pre-mRNA-splicing factor SLT11 n=1 Tax=Pseudomicrostroma glucosiphilum TaxID=1684307 RepID=A0A316U4L9_9BASI|nr:pre-mRNA-splicing factor SLT11 [Pseudomicrostroma glucosiphilum]PWN20130.1 pre-mRNA-splicing factor SLT11 [Pseudomicrostroma glucosiphilum]